LSAGTFVLLLVASALLFMLGSNYFELWPTNKSKLYKAGLPVFFLALSLFLSRQESLAVYGRIAYAFFCASAANLAVALCVARLSRLFKLSDDSIKGMALDKLFEATAIAGTLVALTLVAGIDLGAVFLQPGKLGLGLTIGGLGFVAFAVVAFLQLRSFHLGWKTLASLAPWILVFCFSNALMEELWFRGMFLKPFEPVLGAVASLILTSIAFTGSHIGATYLSRAEKVRFLAILFPLALAWGYTTQFTGSLIGSTLFHAGADLLALNGFIAALYGRAFKPLGVEQKGEARPAT
jgi:membrane protease YdiL (CAAX protease family)